MTKSECKKFQENNHNFFQHETEIANFDATANFRKFEQSLNT